jgi:hypothetical protein
MKWSRVCSLLIYILIVVLGFRLGLCLGVAFLWRFGCYFFGLCWFLFLGYKCFLLRVNSEKEVEVLEKFTNGCQRKPSFSPGYKSTLLRVAYLII